jgi:hypothetical protein
VRPTSRQRRRCRTFHNALPGRRRDKQHHACKGGGADENSTDDSERLAPAFGRHADLGQSERRLIARDARRHGIEETNHDADQRRADGGERDLSDRERGSAGEHADNERADHARATVKGGEARGEAGKEWKGVDGKREQQPAEEAKADNTENKADDNHSGYLRDKGSNGCAFHHHHGTQKSCSQAKLAERRRSRAARAQAPDRDAELPRLVGEVLLDARTGADDDTDRQDL